MKKQFKPLVCVRDHLDAQTRSNLIDIVEKDLAEQSDIIYDSIATVYHAPAGSEREAYARLLACAPELLEKLKKAVTWGETYARETGVNLQSNGPLSMDIDEAHSIIARAEGRTQ